MTSFPKSLLAILPNSTGMVPGWSPTKVFQSVPIGCMSRSRGQKISSLNAIFKNLFVWNYKAQGFHIWYSTSSGGLLPKFFKLCPWGQNWPTPRGHNLTSNCIRKTSTELQTSPPKLHSEFWLYFLGRSPTKVVETILTGCISRSWGKKKVFKVIFKKIFLSKTTRPIAFIFCIYRGSLPKLFKLEWKRGFVI